MTRKSLSIKIEKVKRELMSIEGLRPGSLSTQYNICGKKGCKCKDDPPQKHGPYFQLSLTRKGKSQTKFIKQGDVDMIHEQLNNYKRMKVLVEQWVDLSIELSNLILSEEKR